MNPWHVQRMCGFDTETTGVDTSADRIITAAVVAVGGGQPADTGSWLINPGVDIPAEASEIHGITTEHARDEGRPPAECLEEICVALVTQLDAGVPVVVMNARFDLTLLDRECRRHGLVPLTERNTGRPWAVLDPLVLDKQFDRWRRGGRTLVDLCNHYGARIETAHDSVADAFASLRVIYRMAVVLPKLQRLSPKDLHDWQVGWAKEQAASFQEYLRTKKGQKDAVIEGRWPLVPFEAEAGAA